MFITKGYMFKDGKCIDVSGIKCSDYEMLSYIMTVGFANVDGYLCTLIEEKQEEEIV